MAARSDPTVTVNLSASSSNPALPQVVFIGPPGVGKTSLLHALSGLSRELAPTVGPEVFALSRGGEVILAWDTPGQDKYGSVSESLLAQASLVVSCSDTGSWAPSPSGQVLRVRTKDDLRYEWFSADLATSARTGAGIRSLFDALFTLAGGPPEVSGGCCCRQLTASVTHRTLEEWRLDLLTKP